MPVPVPPEFSLALLGVGCSVWIQTAARDPSAVGLGDGLYTHFFSWQRKRLVNAQWIDAVVMMLL